MCSAGRKALENPNLPTGEIEVEAHVVRVLNEARTSTLLDQ